MSDICDKPQSKYEIDAHVWIGAFAAAQIAIAVVNFNALDSLGAVAGVSGLVERKLTDEMASMQREVIALRQELDASRAAPAKRADSIAPAQDAPSAASPHGRKKN